MAKTKFYCQCSLQKIVRRDPDPPAEEVRGTCKRQPKDTIKTTVTWLPLKYALVGRWLKLKNRDTGEWEDHWCVMSASEPRPAAVVEAMSRDYLNQRNVSDV